jgi:starch synthase
MNIVFVSSEVAPYAKVGGLADVAGSLPQALAKLGHRPTVVMPAYRMILDDPRWAVKDLIETLPVAVSSKWKVDGWVKELDMEGVRVLLIGGEGFFQATASSEIYTPGIEQYLYFSAAVLETIHALDLKPDVVHCNDWQTGFVPVLMREKQSRRWNRTATIFTIHNLAYQGEFGFDILDRLELPHRLFNHHQLETWGKVNFLKSGCVFSDQINTVSPTYAEEIQSPAYGCSLEGLMSHLGRQGRLHGILNGIDLKFFNPETDPALPANFSADDLSGKIICKSRLQAELGLPVRPAAPLMGIVSRLSSQKGIGLVLDVMPRIADSKGQLIVQGLGDPLIANRLRDLEAKFPEHLRFVEEFDADLAQRIYAGSDMFLMPSAYEPCGLGQMIAMRYGTVPVVRKTGGLADTVFDGTNGFVFEEFTADALWDALEEAIETFPGIADWGRYVVGGLNSDHSWERSARTYIDLYQRAKLQCQPEFVAAAAS